MFTDSVCGFFIEIRYLILGFIVSRSNFEEPLNVVPDGKSTLVIAGSVHVALAHETDTEVGDCG